MSCITYSRVGEALYKAHDFLNKEYVSIKKLNLIHQDLAKQDIHFLGRLNEYNFIGK